MRADLRVLVIERVLPERINPSDPLTPGRFIHDINMMLNPGGRDGLNGVPRSPGLRRPAGLSASSRCLLHRR